MGKIGKILFLSLFTCRAWAGVEVAATVDANQISLNDTVTLTVQVSSDETIAVKDPTLPDLEGFQLVGQSSGRESRSVFSGGKFQFLQTQKFYFVLAPRKEGNLLIGAVEVVVNNHAHKTQPITIQVSGQGAGGQAQKRRPPPSQGGQVDDEEDPFFQDADELFSQLLKRRGLGGGGGGAQPGTRTQPTNPDEAFFIQVETDKAQAYVGEQVTATWWLYTRNDIRDIDTLKYPTLQGFWKEDIEVATRLNFQQEVLNGIPWRKALLASYALFPIKEGQGLIDSYKAKCTVLMGSQGMFGFGQPYQFTKASQEIKIKVLPVPAENRPKDYSGGVGEYEVRSWVENKMVPAHQPFSFKIRYDGRGNAKNIDLPPMELPKGLELYDTKSTTHFNQNGTSYKEFEMLLIPRQEGKYQLPEISISFFDPRSKHYNTKKAPPIDITVAPGKAPVNQAGSGDGLASGTTTVATGPVPPELALEWQSVTEVSPLAYGFIWGGIYVATGGVLVWRWWTVLGRGRRRKSLGDALHKRLKTVRASLDQEKWGEVGAGVTNAIYFILGDLAGEGGAGVGIEQIMRKLPPSIRNEIEASMRALLSDFEALSFAPEHLTTKLRDKAVLKQKISEAEKLLGRAIQLFEAEVPEEAR